MSTSRKINYKSDFDFLVSFKDNLGNPVEFLKYDFTAKIYTNLSDEPYVALHKSTLIGEHWERCFKDGDKLHVVMKHHGLERGELYMDISIDTPNDIYSGNVRTVCSKHLLGIKLVGENGDDFTEADIAILAPYVVMVDEEARNLIFEASSRMDELDASKANKNEVFTREECAEIFLDDDDTIELDSIDDLF